MAPRRLTKAASNKVPLPQFIVALLLVKSRPASLSIRDYLTELQSCISNGSRPPSSASRNGHIETTTFWREAYTKSEEAQIGLRARIAELERGSDRAEDTQTDASMPPAFQKKRRGSDVEAKEASDRRQSKRIRIANTSSPMTQRDSQLQDFTRSLQLSASGTQLNGLLHHIYLLLQTTSQRTPVPSEIAVALQQISSDICRFVSSISLTDNCQLATIATPHTAMTGTSDPPTDGAQIKNIDGLTTGVKAITRIFPLLLKETDSFFRMREGQLLQGSVIYSFVKIFNGVLNSICELAAAYATVTANRHKAIAFQLPGLARQSVNAYPKQPTKISEILKKLSELAITMVTSLDSTKVAQASILEGFLFILLQKVGSGLKLFVFGNEEKDVLQNTINNNLQAPRSSYSHDAKEDLQAIEAQAPYLICILERAQAMSTGISQNKAPCTDSTTTNSLKASCKLSRIAQARLQHTLLKAVFGHEASADFEPALEDPLMGPDCDLERHLSLASKPGEVKDWYKHEVWRLVGWDVLTGHIRWTE